MRSWLIRALLAAVQLLPLRMALALGRAGGAAAYHLFPRERRLSLAHLELAFPDRPVEEQQAIAQKMFRNLGELGMEIAQLPRLESRLATYVELDQAAEEALDRARGGKGVVAVTGHIGNWELLFRRIVHSGRPAYAVGVEMSHHALTAMIEKLRGPGRTIWRGAQGSSKKLLRAFRDDAYLAMLIDQDTKVQGVFVPFFGRLAHTPRAAADLAIRTGAGVVTIFIHRRPEGGHRISVEEIDWTSSGDGEADALALTAAMTASIEAEVRHHPDEWVWMHERWKTRPPSAEE